MNGPSPGIAGLDTYALVDGGCRVEVIPSRGAIVTRMCVDGDELLYLDEATVADPAKNVRGGIPVLFPIAGPLPGDTYSVGGQSYSLPQHGFARKLPWTVRQSDASRLVVALSSNEETLRHFPWRFHVTLTFSLTGGRLTLDSEVENQDTRPLPLHLGFHPYFRVPDAAKARARVDTDATCAWDNWRGQDVAFTGLTLTEEEVDLHLKDHSKPGTTLERGPGLRPIRLSWSPEYRVLVVWTLRGKDFVCVEPWTAAKGALATGEGLPSISPGQQTSLHFVIQS
ncbi:aldose 1-epimerase [Corallococcus macrosporus]|uniref:Aldose 1-epimerase family protein n=1 Tax=Myxococcus fulvus (strain ATCC BAA-855 / HW-1) TaxID=483219 RepID=F8CMI5_MYXFH|nr:aldose 1-epimerase [Corallococcus macrosporus]AEI65264.1 aldose 1-epimerase family protein [Corallococcus macrosporus]